MSLILTIQLMSETMTRNHVTEWTKCSKSNVHGCSANSRLTPDSVHALDARTAQRYKISPNTNVVWGVVHFRTLVTLTLTLTLTLT